MIKSPLSLLHAILRPKLNLALVAGSRTKITQDPDSIQNKIALKSLLLVIIFLIWGILSPLWAVQAQSQPALELNISPPTAFIKVQPGSSARHTVTLENASQTDLLVTPKLVDFRADNKTGQPVLTNKLSFPYFSLPSGSLDPITLQARSKAQLTLVIEPPPDAPDQEFPVSILFHSQSLHDNFVGGSSGVTGVMVSNLVILISNQATLPNQLQVKQILTPRLIDSFRPWEFTPVIENRGLAAQVASGSAQLLNWRGQIVEEYTLAPQAILGFSQREVQAINASQPENFVSFQINNKMMFGPYKISLNLNDSATEPGNDSITQFQKTVLILPYSLLVLTLVGVIIFGGLVFRERLLKKVS